MSERDPNEPLAEGTPPEPSDRMAKARAAKKSKKAAAPRVDDNALAALILNLSQKVNDLEAKLAQKDAERDIDLSAIPAAKEIPPGGYFNVGTVDRPDIYKKRWTKADLEKNYPSVTFRPIATVTVSPHGFAYPLTQNVDVTVPSIVRDLHDEYIASQQLEGRRYRSLSFAENVALAEQAMDAPGQQVWSRLFRRPGSLVMNPAEPATEAAPEEAKA